MATNIASCCLSSWAVVILKYLLCLSTGFSCLFSIWTHNRSIFFCNWQFAPAGLHSNLFSVDSDWHRLNLLTDSRRETQTQIWNWPRQQPHCIQVAHCLQRVLCLLLLLLMRQPLQNNCSHSSHLMTTWCTTNATYEIFKKLFPIRIRTALPFQCRHWRLCILQNSKWSANHIAHAHLVCICLEDGSGRYVLFFIIISKIITSWWSVWSYRGCRRDSSIIWRAIVVQQEMNFILISLHFQRCENHLKYFFVSYQFTSLLCKSSLEASLLSCTSGFYILHENSCMIRLW